MRDNLETNMTPFDPSTAALDPRVTPARADIAAKHLAGKVIAARYVSGESFEVVEPQTAVRHSPAPDAPLNTEALKGERVTVYETNEEGWAWGQLESDGYVGWMAAGALRAPGPSPTHKVVVLRTLVFPGPSIKIPPSEALSLGAQINIARSDDVFAVTATGGFIPTRHLAPLATKRDDFVAVAETFLGVPYLWGGKTSFGVDCSGLVQTALVASGINCPRDSDMQEQSLGKAFAPTPNFSNLLRGDLLFWKGHVAIVRDPATIIHANAFHMATAIEPIAEAVARIRAIGSELISVRRM